MCLEQPSSRPFLHHIRVCNASSVVGSGLREQRPRTNAKEAIMAMKRFLVTYLAPASVIEAWKKTPAETRKPAEANMQNLWKSWMSNHHNMFVDKGAGVGKTRRVTAQGSADGKNDILLYSIVEAETHEAASKMFEDHPH